MTISDVITGLSLGSAKTTGWNDTGMLGIGKKADIVVYDRDLYSVPIDKFSANDPLLLVTYVSGALMYKREQ